MQLALYNSNNAINNPFRNLRISGDNNNIKITSHITYLIFEGNSNYIDGMDPNCKIDYIKIKGSNNKAYLNHNCSHVKKDRTNNHNSIIIGEHYFNGKNAINNFNQGMDMLNILGLNYMNLYNNMANKYVIMNNKDMKYYMIYNKNNNAYIIT